jgi:hypothetical protein
MSALDSCLVTALFISAIFNLAQAIDSKCSKPAQKRDRLGRFTK